MRKGGLVPPFLLRPPLYSASVSASNILISATHEPQFVPAFNFCPTCCGVVKPCWRMAEQIVVRPIPKQEHTTGPASERGSADWPTSRPARSRSVTRSLANSPDSQEREGRSGRGDRNTQAANRINGAGLVNDGIDMTFDYRFDNVLGGSLVVGTTATWINKYETETLIINGVVFQDGFDGVGQLNQGTTLYALPEWRAQGYLDFAFGNQNLRWTANFIDQYRDQRYVNTPALDSLVDSTILHNLTYRTILPGDVTLLATVENIFDEDPSFALMELNYDPLTGNPLGRTFKIGLRKSFN